MLLTKILFLNCKFYNIIIRLFKKKINGNEELRVKLFVNIFFSLSFIHQP